MCFIKNKYIRYIYYNTQNRIAWTSKRHYLGNLGVLPLISCNMLVDNFEVVCVAIEIDSVISKSSFEADQIGSKQRKWVEGKSDSAASLSMRARAYLITNTNYLCIFMRKDNQFQAGLIAFLSGGSNQTVTNIQCDQKKIAKCL